MIRKKLVRKTLDMIKKIADEKYNDTFWKEFGTNIKLGVIEDHSNRTRLAKLLRFQSSHHPSDMTSLDQYVERMKEKQVCLVLFPRRDSQCGRQLGVVRVLILPARLEGSLVYRPGCLLPKLRIVGHTWSSGWHSEHLLSWREACMGGASRREVE